MDKFDLHCHSTASDGTLNPKELVLRAHEQGVTALALTDHDTVDGLEEARQTAVDIGMRFIPGIELSTNWEHKCFHVVGLGIDPAHPILLDGLSRQQEIRAERAKKIARKLEKKRIPNAYEAVKAAAGEGMITRTHFADYLVENEFVANQQEAFDKYLARGKAAYVATAWAELREAIGWIRECGGVSVLAHPLRYNLSGSRMLRALSAFKDAGGQGMEVVTGRSSPEDIQRSHFLAQKFQLLASRGSDFHNPADQWIELGRMPELPLGCRPVWKLLDS